MRLLLAPLLLLVLGSARSATAQRADAAPETSRRLALGEHAAETTARPIQLACAPIAGQVFNPNGQPLVGATLLIKGTHQVCVTDAEGRFQLTAPVYAGQVLAVQAAGFATRDVPLADCALPRLVLEQMAGAHIKHSGKRAGQVTRVGTRSTTMK